MKKHLISVAAVLALGLGLAAPAAATPDAPPPPLPQSAQKAEKKIPVIVTLERQPKGVNGDGQLVSDVVAKLGKRYDFTVKRQFSYLVNAFSAYLPESAIADLTAEPGVLAVDRMRVYYPSMESATELTQVDKATEAYGVDGRGLVVSIVDTGIDIAHQDMRLDEGVEPRLAPADGFTAKVPYGYNFADENGEVKDTTASQHGMHVAGIVAANGGEGADIAEDGRINGVAPNAQLLAMKVFSNNPDKKGAAADDVMAAVEESVKRGADVINLSLGFPNGHEGQSVGEQRALANARAAGVEVIVAAGNEGQNGSATGEADDALGYLDDGTVGSPSTGTGAWSVASIENSYFVRTLAVGKQGDAEHKFGYDLQTGAADGQPHEIVDFGYGSVDDSLTKDVAGKFALIQRGSAPGSEPITFADKFKNAQIAKAAGVILYNHADGGDEIPGMGGIDEFTFPGAAIGHSDGVKLLEMINAGTTTVALTDERLVMGNPDSLHPSAFTSWGSGPELGFKPEIAGIGGKVYSTINDNKYSTMSGTSMAAPHVAGVAALMIEDAQESHPGLSRSEVIVRNRTALSNTASILADENGVPFAPRQMGAGLVQVKDALATKVLATVDGEPTIALKEVKGSKSFTVTLTNEADEARTFTAGSTCVVNENNSVDEASATFCSQTDKVVPSQKQITVPAGGSAEVTYTLSVAGDPHWTQGWVTFESADEDQPDLSVPYLGFAGDWNAERIIDYPAYKGFPEPILAAVGGPTRTSLHTIINEGEYTFGDGEQYISPNDDGLADVLYAKIAMLRNAKRLEVSILDESGNTVRQLGSEDEVIRSTLQSQLQSPVNSMQANLSSMAFNGAAYNPQTASFETLPDGKYTYRVSASLGSDWPAQNLDMSFGIDTVAPNVEVLGVEKNDDGNYVVRVKATDDFSGVNAVQGRFTWPGYVARDDSAQGDIHTLVIPGAIADMVGYVEVYASDYATNVVRKTIMLGEKLLVESDPTLSGLTHLSDDTESDQTGEPLVNDSALVLTGRVDGSIVQVRVGDQVVDVPASGRFELHAKIEQGENEVTVEGLDAAGNVVASKTYKFVYDNEAPVVTVTSPANVEDIEAQVAAGKVRIEGTVTDNLNQIETVTVDGDAYPVVDGKFSIDVDVTEDTFNINVYARDKAGNLGVGTVVLKEPDEAAPLRLEANLGFNDRFNVVSGENEALSLNDDGTYSFLFSGTFNYVPGRFMVNGEEVQVSEDGKFEVPVLMKEGITDFNIKIVDVDGTELVNTQVKTLLDLHAPKLEMTKPSINPDGALYLRAPGEVEFAGSVSDNAFGYELSINGDSVEQFMTLDDPGAEVSKRDFSKKITAADGDKILVILRDHLENGYVQLIPVIVDDEAPTISIDSLEVGEKMKVGNTREITVRVEDKNLDTASVYLDGEVVESAQTELKPASGAQTQLVEGIDELKRLNSDVNGFKDRTLQSLSQSAASTEKDEVAEDPVVPEAEGSVEEGQSEAEDDSPLFLTFTVGPDFEVGEHTLMVTGVDKAGNQASTTVPFSVENAEEQADNDTEPGDDNFVPGIDEDDLTDPNKNPGEDSVWIPGKVGSSDGVNVGAGSGSQASGPLSRTGTDVAGLSALAGALLLVGVIVRRRAGVRAE